MARKFSLCLTIMLAGCSTGNDRGPADACDALSLFAETFAAAAPQADAPLSVVAQLVESPTRDPAVRFKLTNVQRQPVSIDVNSLPWTYDDTVEMTAVLTTGIVLPRLPHVGGLVSEQPPQVLAPGESISGERPLAAYLSGSRRSKDVDTLLLWTYRQEGHVYAGMMVLRSE